MSIGYLSRGNDLLHRSPLYSESDVIEESVVEENSLLIDIADKSTQITDAHILYVGTVNQNLTLLHVVIAWQEVDQRRFTRTRLPHQRNSSSARYGQIDMFQHLAPSVVAEADVAELNLMLQPLQLLRMIRLLDGIFGQQYFVDTLHRSESLRNVITCLGEFLQRIDDTIENNKIEDERRSIDSRTVVQNKCTSKPQNNDNEARTQKFTHWMGQSLTRGHAVDCISIVIAALIETLFHLLLGNESLDDAQATQRLLQLGHRVAPLALCLERLPLQFLTYSTHHPTHGRHYKQCEHGQLPTDGNHRGEINDNQNGILDEHIQRTGDGRLHLGHVTTHAGDNVSLTLFRKES